MASTQTKVDQYHVKQFEKYQKLLTSNGYDSKHVEMVGNACLSLLMNDTTSVEQQRQMVQDYAKLLAIRASMAKTPPTTEHNSKGMTFDQVVENLNSVLRRQLIVDRETARLLAEKISRDSELGKRRLDDDLNEACDEMEKRHKQNEEWLHNARFINEEKGKVNSEKEFLREWYDAWEGKREVEMEELSEFWEVCLASEDEGAQYEVRKLVVGMLDDATKLIETVGGREGENKKWVQAAAKVHQDATTNFEEATQNEWAVEESQDPHGY